MNYGLVLSGKQLTDVQQRQQQMLADRQKALDDDPAIQSAQRNLEKAKTDYEQLQTYVKTLPLQRRLEYNPNMQQAKQAVSGAEQQLRNAINANSSRAYSARVQAEQAEKEKKQTALQEQHAAEQEAEAKQEYKQHYLSGGGTAQQFEQAWPGIWQKELETRAQERVAATKAAIKRSHYAL